MIVAKKKQVVSIVPPGSIVSLAGGMDAGVLEVKIGTNFTISYHVVFWLNSDRRTMWVDSFEVAPIYATKGGDGVILELTPGQLGG